MGSRSKKGASQPKAPPPRLAVLGAGGVGKSSMVLRYLEDRFSEEYIPTIEAVYSTTIEYENQQIGVELLDTAGTESFMAMRNLYIAHSCGFLLVYSIVDESTFTELKEIYQSVRYKDPDGPCPPMVLCGSKSDLFERRVISWERGEQQARDWGCSFIEVSAMTGARVTVAFRQLYAQVHLAQPRRPGKPLCVLS